MRIFFLLLGCFCLLAPRAAKASRHIFMPVGYYAKQMDLAIVADVTKPREPDFNYNLKIREVLQGQAQVGEVISIPIGDYSADILPYGDMTATVLLKKRVTEEQNKNQGLWQVLEAYRSPQSIASLRLLLATYRLPTERERLLSLQKLSHETSKESDSAMITAELNAALSGMRQPGNFGLIESSLPLLDEKQRENMMRTLGTMNDLRAVPLLLKVLQTAEKSTKAYAAQTLAYHYPGAPGVTEAMRALLNDETSTDYLKRTAQDYLAKRDATIQAERDAALEKTKTPFHHAKTIFQGERKAEGALALLRAMENEKPDEYFSWWTVEEILPFLDVDGKERLRTLLLRKTAGRKDYLQAENLIKLMQKIPDTSFIPALQKLMHDMTPSELPYSLSRADMLATFALLDLGPRARELGAAQVMDNIQQRLKPGMKPRFLEAEILLRQLAWLADPPTWQSAYGILDPQWQREWQKLNTLRPVLTAGHGLKHEYREREGRELVALLQNPPDELSMGIRDWVIYRLGDLGERAAIQPLLQLLPRMIGHYPHSAQDALMRIGGTEVEKGASFLLRHADRSVRAQAMEILKAVRGQEMLPVLRQILSEPDELHFGNKDDAALMLGALGTPDDLPLLLPLADFWKADRSVQRWAVSSLASIRERFNYDLKGPIQKVG